MRWLCQCVCLRGPVFIRRGRSALDKAGSIRCLRLSGRPYWRGPIRPRRWHRPTICLSRRSGRKVRLWMIWPFCRAMIGLQGWMRIGMWGKRPPISAWRCFWKTTFRPISRHGIDRIGRERRVCPRMCILARSAPTAMAPGTGGVLQDGCSERGRTGLFASGGMA